jgi:large subunit ribosomal protein L3
MAGHLGHERVTTQNLKVVRVDVEQGLILIKGSVPGPDQGWVIVQDAKKTKAPDGLPYPAAVRTGAAVEAVAEPAVTETQE